MARRLGLVEVARLMCAAVTGSPEEMAAGEVFGRFRDCCRRALEERQRQGLPILDLKWRPAGKRAKSPHRGGPLDDSGDGEGWDWEELRPELKRHIAGVERRLYGPRETGYTATPASAPDRDPGSAPKRLMVAV